VTDRRVTLVLDASAIVAYTRRETAVHVGDVLIQVFEDDAVAVLPAVCLAEAVPAVADRGLLDVLVAHEATMVLADGVTMWRDVAAMAEVTGRPDAASAALAAIDFRVNVLSRTPGLYAGIGKAGMVIEIPE
jgi:hypothetical protein